MFIGNFSAMSQTTQVCRLYTTTDGVRTEVLGHCCTTQAEMDAYPVKGEWVVEEKKVETHSLFQSFGEEVRDNLSMSTALNMY